MSALGPILVVIEMSITTKLGKERMGQGATAAIKWIIIAVTSSFESDFDVWLSRPDVLAELQIGIVRPNLESIFHFCIDFGISPP